MEWGKSFVSVPKIKRILPPFTLHFIHGDKLWKGSRFFFHLPPPYMFHLTVIDLYFFTIFTAPAEFYCDLFLQGSTIWAKVHNSKSRNMLLGCSDHTKHHVAWCWHFCLATGFRLGFPFMLPPNPFRPHFESRMWDFFFCENAGDVSCNSRKQLSKFVEWNCHKVEKCIP